MKNKYIGSMLGLAIGDAFGAPVEFLERGKFPYIDRYYKGGKFNLSIGEYTDDTAMALCLAQSLIECNGLNQKDQLEKYIKWFKEGYMSATGRAIGCGKQVYKALFKFMATNCNECGNSKFKKGAGNGSLMRIAPIALFYKNHPLKTVMKMAEKSSYTTHGLKICADACRVYSGLIVGALDGIDKAKLLSKEYFKHICNEDKDYKYDDLIKIIMEGSYKIKSEEEINSSGYVINTLEAALWAFYNTNSFKEGLILAVNLGNDSDTIGAIYGQLAGAFYGEENIDEYLKENLKNKNLIEEIALKLFELSNN